MLGVLGALATMLAVFWRRELKGRRVSAVGEGR
jgi:hypothetical protein